MRKKQIKIHGFPQDKYIDGVRWLPCISPVSKLVISSLYDPTTCSTTLQLHSFTTQQQQQQQPSLSPLSSFPSPSLSRTSSLHVTTPFITLSTLSGSLHFLSYNLQTHSHSLHLKEDAFHVGPILSFDVLGRDCVTVGEDGRVNFVSLGEGKLRYRRVYNGDGLGSFTAVKWASDSEFVTAGYGSCLQWWDQRRTFGQPVFHFNPNWSQKAASGVVHSIDIHPSRKHICMAGGSSGTVFAWDLRWPQQPIVLSGVGTGDRQSQPISESEVWEVQFDCHLQSSAASMSSSMLPVMMCSEDGILAVLEPGVEPMELLEEPCAINGFDIDKQNHSDIVCSLEWESIAIISRS